MNTNNRILYRTIIISGLAMGIYYLISMVLTPYITENLGADAYGFVTLSKNFSTYAGVLTVALDSYATRYIAVSYHKGDLEKSNIYFNSVLKADIVIGLVFLSLFIIFSFAPEYFLNVPDGLIDSVKILFALTGFNFCLTTIGTVFNTACYIKNRLDLCGTFKGISYIAEALILVLFYKTFEPRIWYVAVGTICSTFVIFCSNIFLHKSFLPEIKVRKKLFSLEAVKELVFNGIWNSINSLGNVLNSGLDVIVSNLLLTPLAMGQIAVVKTISGIFYALIQTISQPFQPNFLKLYSNNEKDGLVYQLKFSAIVCGLYANLAFAGFLSLGKLFYDLWIPSQDTSLIWMLTVISLLGSVVEGAVYPLYYIYTLTVKNKLPCITTIAGGVLNVLCKYLLIKNSALGVYAIVLTTAIVTTVINLIFNPLYMCFCLKIKSCTFYSTILKHCISCMIMCVAFYAVKIIVMPGSWISLIFLAIIDIVLGTVIHVTIQGVGFDRILKLLKGKKGHEK